MIKFFFLITLLFLVNGPSAWAEAKEQKDETNTSPEPKRNSFLKLSVGTEVYFFKFEDKVSGDYTTEGRERKLEYKYTPVQTTNVTAAITLFKSLTLSGTYGDSKFSFMQNQTKSDNPPDEVPSWMSRDNSSLYGVSLKFFGFRILHSSYKFSSGKVNVKDVSGDPEGERGKTIATFNNNMEFRDSEISYGIGKIYNLFSKEDPKEERSDFIKYWVVPLQISYIYNEAVLPVIPYFFRTIAGQLYFKEGKIQEAHVKNSMWGIGWEWKYGELYGYSGSSRSVLTDDQNVKRKLKTNGSIAKFRLKYDWQFPRKNFDYTITPYGQMTYYNFDDTIDGNFITFGGDFFIYKLGLNVGIKI